VRPEPLWGRYCPNMLFGYLWTMDAAVRDQIVCARISATSVKDRYHALMWARASDVKRQFAAEIDPLLAVVAPNAAAVFVVRRNYTSAEEAVQVAKSLGQSNNPTVQAVEYHLAHAPR
jgi:hypothetical protein